MQIRSTSSSCTHFSTPTSLVAVGEAIGDVTEKAVFAKNAQQHEPSTLGRRLSNFFRVIGGREIYPAKRFYKVLEPTVVLEVAGYQMSVKDIAKAYCPRLFTIHRERIEDAEVRPDEILFEILPPQEGETSLSIVYHIGAPSEHLPLPIIGTLYDWVRPIWYGSKRDYEAIVLKIDRSLGTVLKVAYETSQYTAEPESYYVKNFGSLHQCHEEDVRGAGYDREHPVHMVEVSWNGALDIRSRAEEKGYRLDAAEGGPLLWECEQPPLRFLENTTYRKIGFDLRSKWLNYYRPNY